MGEFRTYYDVLGVEESASLQELKAARNRLAREYHTDGIPEHRMQLRQEMEEKLKEVNEAYEVLKASTARAAYDAKLAEHRAQAVNDVNRSAASRGATPPPPPPSGPATHPPSPSPGPTPTPRFSRELVERRIVPAAVLSLLLLLSLLIENQRRGWRQTVAQSPQSNAVQREVRASDLPVRLVADRDTPSCVRITTPVAWQAEPNDSRFRVTSDLGQADFPRRNGRYLEMQGRNFCFQSLETQPVVVVLTAKRAPDTRDDKLPLSGQSRSEPTSDGGVRTDLTQYHQVAGAVPAVELGPEGGIDPQRALGPREIPSLRLGQSHGGLTVHSNGRVTLQERPLFDVRDRIRLFEAPTFPAFKDWLFAINWDDDKGGFDALAIRGVTSGSPLVRHLTTPRETSFQPSFAPTQGGASHGCDSFIVATPILAPRVPWALFTVSPIEGTVTIAALNVDTGERLCQAVPEPRIKTRDDDIVGFKLTPQLDDKTVGFTQTGVSMLFTFRCSPWARRPCDDRENDVVAHDVVASHLEFQTGRSTFTAFRSQVPFEANVVDPAGWRPVSDYALPVLRAGAYVGSGDVDDESIRHAIRRLRVLHGGWDANEFAPNTLYVLLTEGNLGSRVPGWFRDMGTAADLLNTRTPVRIDGVGPVTFGMTLGEANRRIGGVLVVPQGEAGADCTYGGARVGMGSIAFMINREVIVRADVYNDSMSTAEGARVGSSEADVLAIYKGRVEVSPHRYFDEGHYLTVRGQGRERTDVRYVFETERGVVTTFRSGLSPQVGAVEGCS